VALPPAGWYLDPHTQTTMRWWSGEQWTEHQQPIDPVPASTPVPVPVPVPRPAPASAPAAYVPMGGESAQGAAEAEAPRLTGRALRIERERQARRNNVFAWLGLLFAVISFLFNPFAVLSVLAVIFASVGLARAQNLSDAGVEYSGRGTAVAGLVVGLIASVIFLVRFFAGMQSLGF
jgi:hypothetical protein